MVAPYLFDEFFASGKEESISPFLTPSSKRIGKNLTLKSAFLSVFLLASSFTLSFFNPGLSHFLLVLVYFFSGTPALIKAIEDLQNLEINIDVLMTLAAFLSILINSAMEGGLLLVLFELSGAMENAVIRKTKSTLFSLHQLSPKRAFVLDENGVIYEKSIHDIQVGMQLLIKAGEVIPLDGKVIQGNSFVNLVHLTGESLPIPKTVGDEVQAGSSNLEGYLTIQVSRISSDSTLSRIIRLITQAHETKPKLESLFDRFSKGYATTIIGIFGLLALFLPHLFSIPYLGYEGSIYRALTFLITASPCALIIATPTAYLSAISSCAAKGILLKGGFTLDAIASCHAVAFDKTGTLTTGELELIDLKPLIGHFNADMALQVAASLEQNAVHPIAKAILKKAKAQGLELVPLEEFQALAGLGLKGSCHIQGKKIGCAIGHSSLIDQLIDPKLKEAWNKAKHAHDKETLSTSYLLLNQTVFAFRLQDSIRAQAKEAIVKLKRHIPKVVMLTGDHEDSASRVGKALGIPEVYSNLRPVDKLDKIALLDKEEGVLMIGDGINDAPALARASVGISMGQIGSATAIEASAAVFLHDDLSLIDWLFTKAHHTLHVVKQNLFLSCGVILLATTPAVLGFIPLWLAVILHEGGTVIVGLNSLRLLRK